MAAILCQLSIILAGLLLHNTAAIKAGDTKRSDDASISSLQTLVQQQAGVIQQQAGIIQQLAAKVQVMETKVTSLESRQQKQVAFHAYFTEGGAIDIGQSAPIIFSHVSANVGNGYNANTGVFTAPASGVYLFLLSLKGAGSTNGNFGVDKSGTMIIETNIQVPSILEHSSGSTIVHVNAGETVLVRQYSGTTVIDKWWDTTFTGVLLYPD